MAKLLNQSLPIVGQEYDGATMQRALRDIEIALSDKELPLQVEGIDENNAITWFFSQMPTYYKNAKVDLTTTSVTTLYTAPAATTAIFKSLIVADDSAGTSTITVTLTDAAGAVFVLFSVKATVASGTVDLLSQPLVVQESEILKVTAANANKLHVVGSYIEIS